MPDGVAAGRVEPRERELVRRGQGLDRCGLAVGLDRFRASLRVGAVQARNAQPDVEASLAVLLARVEQGELAAVERDDPLAAGRGVCAGA